MVRVWGDRGSQVRALSCAPLSGPVCGRNEVRNRQRAWAAFGPLGMGWRALWPPLARVRTLRAGEGRGCTHGPTGAGAEPGLPLRGWRARACTCAHVCACVHVRWEGRCHSISLVSAGLLRHRVLVNDGVQPAVGHQLAVRPWARRLPSLCLSSLGCKMRGFGFQAALCGIPQGRLWRVGRAEVRSSPEGHTPPGGNLHLAVDTLGPKKILLWKPPLAWLPSARGPGALGSGHRRSPVLGMGCLGGKTGGEYDSSAPALK